MHVPQETKIVKKQLFILVLFISCYTKNKKPDYDFMNKIKEQAGLDSTLKTQVELRPAKYFFGTKKNSEQLSGFFYIKNVGDNIFNPISIQSNCDCVAVDYIPKAIMPNDSLKVTYKMAIKNRTGFISNTIVAIGNCQFGNQTFYLEGTIFDK